MYQFQNIALTEPAWEPYPIELTMHHLVRDNGVRTPALVIDGEIVRSNIQRLADFSKGAGIHVRPHTKTHKSRFLAGLQLAAGAIGLTVAKPSEAESISDAGSDVLVAYPPLGAHRADQLACLAQNRTVHAAVDSESAISAASDAARKQGTTVGLLVDLDVGLKRTGVSTPDAALRLAQIVDRTPHVRLDGIMVYPGHVWNPKDQQVAALKAVNAIIEETLELWRRQGLAAQIISGGSTPTAYQSNIVSHLTEIRPGTYIFNDMNTLHGGYCSQSDCAARIYATVVSDAVPNQIVIDAGSKTLSSDLCVSATDSGFGFICKFPQAKITRLSEEHAQVDVSKCNSRPRVGDIVSIIPNHVCPCMNLFSHVWWTESNREPVALTVDGRGKVQ